MSPNFNQWKQILCNKDALIEKLSGEISVCEWGSCQYYSANNIFKLYLELKESKLTFEKIQELLYFEFKYDKILSFNLFKENMMNYHFFENLREDLSYNFDLNEMKDTLKFNLELINTKSIDEIFNILRKNAYDLWTVIDIIFPYYFENIDFDIDIESKGYGPLLNQEFQAKNFETGIKAAILIDLGLVKDHSVFKDFDT
jgi:hypothetical protein